MASLRRTISSTNQVLMLRMGCLCGTHWQPFKYYAKDIDKDVDMDVIGQAGDEAGWAA